MIRAYEVDAVLVRDDLPELGIDVIAALTALDMDELARWFDPPSTADEWKPNSIMGCTLFRCFHRESLHTSRDISLVEVKMQLGLLLHGSHVLIVQRSVSLRVQWL